MMHSGEEWFKAGWPEYIFLIAVVVIVLLLIFSKRVSMKAFQDFIDTINTAGGHIVILTILTGWFFVSAMRFFFHTLGLPDEVITKHDAIIMNAVTFLTGSAFGGAWGALIKTMSGGKANGTPVPPSSATADTMTVGLVPADGKKDATA
jgi:hypothetical protein